MTHQKKECKYCCEKHVDIAFDDFINSTETFPCMDKVSIEKCSYCNENAIYILKKNENSAE
ncbi:CxxH/CxxC protein [Clostridium oceanicum]|uniref:CxxH/CxxC protein n=1 Tax=Clostridium oceanicum TaxID=1543 RepID=A0ABP3V452_9CLOT